MSDLTDLQNAVMKAKSIAGVPVHGQPKLISNPVMDDMALIRANLKLNLQISDEDSSDLSDNLQLIEKAVQESKAALESASLKEPESNLSKQQQLEFYYIKGISAQEVGWYKVAQDCFNHYLAIAEDIKDIQAIIKSYISLGNIEFFLNNHIESMQFYLKANNIALDQKIEVPDLIARGFLGMANIYVYYKRYESALIMQRQALIYAKTIVTKDLTIQSLLQMIPTLLQLQQHDLALNITNKVIQLLPEKEKDEWLAESYNYQGVIYLEQEQYDEALYATTKAYELSSRINAAWAICLNLSLLGQIFAGKQDYIKATEYLQKAVHMTKKMNFAELEKQIKHHLMLIYDKTLMHKEVLDIIKESDLSLDNNYKTLNAHLKEEVDNQIQNMDLMLDMLEVVKQNEQNQHRVSLLELENKLDALTGLHNRRALDGKLTAIITAKEKSSLIMLDIDFFKKINDTYGHTTGDKVLKEMAYILSTICRKDDFLARFGGEELSIIVNNIDKEVGIKTAERVRVAVQDHKWENIAPNLKVTISLGIYLNEGYYKTPEDWVAAADKELYRAKHLGRNRVCYEGSI